MNAARRNRRRRSSLVGFLIATLLLPWRLLVWLYDITLGRMLYAMQRRRRQRGSGIFGFLASIGDIILMPFIVIATGLWNFLLEWTSSREGRSIAFGLPALIFGGLVVAAIAYGEFGPDEQLVGQYENAADVAMTNGKYREAKVYFEKLARLRTGDERYRYFVALTLDLDGDEARAFGMMTSLAPLDRPGYARAHFWLVKKLLEREEITVQERAMAKQHLRLAIQADSRDSEIRYVYARLLLQDGDFGKSLVQFEKLADENPLIRIQVADINRELYRRTGNEEYAREAGRYIQSAREAYVDACDKNPTDFQNWFWLHQTQLFENDFAGAMNTLSVAYRESGNENAQVAMARVQLLWAESILRQGKPEENLDEVLSHLETALSLKPNYQAALAMLVKICDLPELATDEAIRLLNDHLVESEAPSLIHFMLGTRFASDQELEKAMFHFNKALEQNPRMSPVLNNMAWVLINIPDEEQAEARREQALVLINQAIEIDPGQLTYFDTRAQIYVQNGDMEQAVRDFEKAAPELAGRSDRYHDDLAKCYVALAQPELADAHRRKAEQIRLQRERNAAVSGEPNLGEQ